MVNRSNFRERAAGPDARGKRAGALVRQRGFSLVELIATMILLGIVCSVSISTLAVVARQRRSAEERQFALQHAANLLERTTSMGWSELPAGLQTVDPPSVDLQSMLPSLVQRVEVTGLPQDSNSKLVTVSLTWKNRQGQMIAPVHLSGWVYPPPEVSP